ncbi:MAG TPA: phosphatase PAP2 family protein [Gemmatimonadaceae bacterium]|jgi:membrane-associated phospholipid phosphatase
MRILTRRSLIRVTLMIVVFAASLVLDGWAYRHLVRKTIYDGDLGRMLRIAGFLPTWAIVSLALILCDLHQRDATDNRWRRWRGLLPLTSATLAGLVGEILKVLLRRERPETQAGAYVFRSWSQHPLSSGGLAFPSSHAIVAFGALAMLSHLYPRARWLWFAVAAGCAITRVLARAHFLSDVVLAGIVGSLVATALWDRWEGMMRSS